MINCQHCKLKRKTKGFFFSKLQTMSVFECVCVYICIKPSHLMTRQGTMKAMLQLLNSWCGPSPTNATKVTGTA